MNYGPRIFFILQEVYLHIATKYYLLPHLYRFHSTNYIMYLHPGREDCQFWNLRAYECRCNSFHAGTQVAALHSKVWLLKNVQSHITE
jgi:hypothetical protein